MSKTNEETQQPSVYDDLLKNGTAVLEAPTREALAEMVDGIPAQLTCAMPSVLLAVSRTEVPTHSELTSLKTKRIWVH